MGGGDGKKTFNQFSKTGITMAGMKYPDIDPATHNLWSIYGYPKFGPLSDRINEKAQSREEAHQMKESLKAEGYTKLMIKPVKYRHDKQYRPRENQTFK
jgi:hypothetical protein